jgi:hypothetical protein
VNDDASLLSGMCVIPVFVSNTKFLECRDENMKRGCIPVVV